MDRTCAAGSARAGRPAGGTQAAHTRAAVGSRAGGSSRAGPGLRATGWGRPAAQWGTWWHYARGAHVTDGGRCRVSRYRRRAVGVEGVDGLETPGLTLGSLGLGPRDDLVVGGEQQARAGVAQLDTVTAGLPH